MTNSHITPAGISALATLIHEARPDWHRRGIAAALHKLADTTNVIDLGIAALRAAGDPTNETPEAFAHLNNRAWDSNWWLPCRLHPETRARTPAGECASCRADRVGTDGVIQPLQRHSGTPLDPTLRDQMLADIHRPHPIAQRQRPEPVTAEAREHARRELEQVRATSTRSTTPETTGAAT